MSLSRPVRAIGLFFVCITLSFPAFAADKSFVVNLTTDAGDATLADGFCDTNPNPGDDGQCTLRAAIQQANNEVPTTLHSITFSVTKVTLDTLGLPGIIQPTIIDGGDGETRVEIDGNGQSCFTATSPEALSNTSPSTILPEANNSRFENLVVYNCTGLAAFNLNGHGFVVYNNYIGTDATGNAAAANPNTGRGIDIAAGLEDGGIPNTSLTLPGDLQTIGSIVLFLASAAPDLPPSGIVQNVISGNGSHGIDIHGRYMSTAIVFDNKIGVGADGTTKIPNGTAGSTPEHGVYINAEAYLNFVGINNIIAGNDLDPESDGVRIDTGAVPFPNFVAANDIGASKNSAYATDLGNGGVGIRVGSARPTNQDDVDTGGIAQPTIVNPTGLSVVIGPGNIVGYNGQGSCADDAVSCTEGGIAVFDSTSDGVRIWGNLVGINDPSSFIDIANKGDGINVVGTNIEVGGDTLVEGNLIGSNDRHGLVIRGGSSTNRVTAHANYIGVVPGGLPIGNSGHGVWVTASGNQIGGATFANERNVIAYNGGHAIKVEDDTTTFGNLIRQNEIYNVASGFLAIDLDNPENTTDATDNGTVVDRSTSALNYANWQQNTITIDSTGAAGTSWTLRSALDKSYRIEFFSAGAPGEAKTFLCDVTVVADQDDELSADPTAGKATGTTGCAAAAGLYVSATVTDLSPPEGAQPDRPGFPGEAISNTSELSNSLLAPDQVTFSSATYSGAEGSGTIIVTLERVGTSNAAGVSVVVADLLTGSATAGVDYTLPVDTTIEWAGTDATPQDFVITVTNDGIFEAPETIRLALQGPSNAEVGAIPEATVTIGTDADSAPSFEINDGAATEGPGASITFTVTRTGATEVTSTVNFQVLANSASALDFSAPPPATLTFLPAESTKDIVVNIVDDTIFEQQEQFTVALSGETFATIADNAGIGSINDNDSPTITIDDVSQNEGNAGTTAFTFTVTLSNETSTNIDVNWATAPGTATVATDYASNSGTVTFLAGGAPPVLTQTVTVNVVGDVDPESNETFFVDLSNESAGSIADPQGLGTIQNDDAAPTTLVITDAVVTEGTDATIVFTVTRGGDTTGTSSVDYTVVAGGASSVSDYSVISDPLSDTLSFAASETSKTVTLGVLDDFVVEPTETFTVELTNAVGAVVNDNIGLGTINDDDTTAIAITDVSLDEGTGGPTPFNFTVTLTNPSTTAVTVDWTTADSSATVADSDYTAASGTITFAPLDTSETVGVAVGGDAVTEPDEVFFINLSNNAGALMPDTQATGTIVNDDAASSVAIADAAVTEGTDASIVFTVTRSGDTTQPATVDFQVAAASAGTPGDYDGTTNGTLTFVPGDTSETIPLTLVNDSVYELVENFSVTLSNPTIVTISDGTAIGTIDDNDPLPAITINDVSQLETDAASTFTFTVTLSNASSQEINVDFATADGTATQPADYGTTSGTVTFVAGDIEETVVVSIVGDDLDEPAETFTVNLTNPSNATNADGIGNGTIQNDDAATPTFTVDSVTEIEGNAGTSSFLFTVTLAPLAGVQTTVDVATSNATAIAGEDYVSNNQTLTFPAGTATQSFTVTVNGDTTFEADETFNVALSNATGGALISGSGVGTITNDDLLPTISITDASQLELDAGTAPMTFTISLSNPSSQSISVDWASADGTASTLTSDYNDSGATVTFLPGEISKDITVGIVGDTTVEPNEAFTVNLSNPTNATIADPSGTGTILDDDGIPTIVINDPTVGEGTPTITFTVTRTGDTSGTSSVDYTVVPGTATTPADYTASAINARQPRVQANAQRPVDVIAFSALNGTLNFAAAEVTKSITLDIVDDTTFELTETFTVALSNPAGGATLGDASAMATITDADPEPTISIANVSQSEGNAGLTTFTFNVTLSNPSSLPITVDFATADGSATVAGLDYLAVNGTLTFAPGVVAQSASVSVDGDTTEEPAETFLVNLTNPTNATIADAQAVGTIVNDDGASAALTDIPALGGRELAILAALLAAVAIFVMRRV